MAHKLPDIMIDPETMINQEIQLQPTELVRVLLRDAFPFNRQELSVLLAGCDMDEHLKLHCLELASMIEDLCIGPTAVMVAGLYPLVEAGKISLDDVNDGSTSASIGRLLQGLIELKGLHQLLMHGNSMRPAKQKVHIRHMLLAMVEDPRIVVIKLADHLRALRSAREELPEFSQELAVQTIDLYAPLANRLGIWQLKWEMEDWALRYLEPDAYRGIAAWLDERRSDREGYIHRAMDMLEQKLEQYGITAQITGRPKHLYSIWRKMQKKQLGFDELYDVRGLRILVEREPTCYECLGVVHSLWQPIPGQFDDYIASPKENHYQSLHTAVVGPEGKPLELQIRTHTMHKHAELGVAAHWRYKDDSPGKVDESENRITWLRRLLEVADDEDEAALFERFRSEIVEDRIYVITPRGDVIDLPFQATGLDFAYAVHTEIGHRCRGIKVNGRIVSLNHKVKNGDRVEVLTSREAKPSRDWLVPQFGYLTTSRARTSVRQWFRKQHYHKNMSSGRDMLERELKRLGVANISYGELADSFQHATVEDFLAALGSGDINIAQVNQHIQPEIDAPTTFIVPSQVPERIGTDAISVHGVGNLLSKMAHCCHPVPPDEIQGYITVDQGISVHRRKCANLLYLTRKSPERSVQVEWRKTEYLQIFPVTVHIEAYDRAGLLRDVSGVMAEEKINVIGVKTLSDPATHKADMNLTIEVSNLSQLSRVLNRISRLPNVFKSSRH